MVGAAKLQPSLAQAFFEKFGIPLLEGYGATEMAPVIAANIPDREYAGLKQTGARPGTVGQPVPGVAIKVVHPDTGDRLPYGSEGLLLVKGPNRMLGYLNRPSETNAVLRDGWYITGDIVKLDTEGFIQIVDRQSRFSKIGGEMVPHRKIEEVLQLVLPGIPSAITCIEDRRKGERLVAFVAAVNVTSQEVWQKLMASGLPKICVPKTEDIHVIDTLPHLLRENSTSGTSSVWRSSSALNSPKSACDNIRFISTGSCSEDVV